MSQLRHVSRETGDRMAYLLIFDLRGGSTAHRRRVNRYLTRVARRVQQSVWEFRSMAALKTAAELVAAGGGRAIAFMKSDRLLLDVFQFRQALDEMSQLRHNVSGKTLTSTVGGEIVSGKTKCLT